jgi:hypothetical protein
VHFVDDIHLPSDGAGGVVDAFPERTDIINAPVAGRIDLDYIETPALGDGDTCLARIARLASLRIETVHRPGENPAGACLSRAPWTAEEIRVTDTLRTYRVQESSGDRLLAHYFAEGLRSPLPIEDFR